MNIHIDIREFFDIHVWICYGFSDQGIVPCLGKTYVGTVRPNEQIRVKGGENLELIHMRLSHFRDIYATLAK